MGKNIYWIVRMASDKYRVFAEDKNARPYIESLNLLSAGKSLSEIWEPVILPLYLGEEEPLGEENERRKPVPDFARGVLGLAMNEKAYSILQSLIEGQATPLKLNTEAGLYYELDIQKIHCIDLKESETVFFSSGKVMRVEKYKFYWEKIETMHIFKSLDAMLKPIFVSNKFKEIVEENNLTGLTFHHVPLVDE